MVLGVFARTFLIGTKESVLPCCCARGSLQLRALGKMLLQFSTEVEYLPSFSPESKAIKVWKTVARLPLFSLSLLTLHLISLEFGI